ncbi:hypothetical protein HDE_01303 [Halotydeus destructor]|nr:hypothetical protein HDE_01303 [Halotydeus destructor]
MDAMTPLPESYRASGPVFPTLAQPAVPPVTPEPDKAASGAYPGPPGAPGSAVAAKERQPRRPIRKPGAKQPDKAPRVLYFLGLKNPLRKLCIDIVEWKYPCLGNFQLTTNCKYPFLRKGFT